MLPADMEVAFLLQLLSVAACLCAAEDSGPG
jgi:hypothetical protein